jgi:hypothetical protein
MQTTHTAHSQHTINARHLQKVAEMVSFLYQMHVVTSPIDVFAYLVGRTHTRYLDDASMFYKDYVARKNERP